MKANSTAAMARRHPDRGGDGMTAKLDLGGAPEIEVALPKGAGAVMASRASAGVMPEAAKGLDFFPTPPWAARAGAELIKQIQPNARTCWDPACGAGHMVHGLRDYFPGGVAASDIADHGAGLDGWDELDFLHPAAERWCAAWGRPDWIVTNPPFRDGAAFIRQAWKLAGRGVAMLLRTQFIESAERHALFTGDCPLGVFAPFSERVPMVAGRWDPDASSATSYAWFICDKAMTFREPVVRLIGPGTRARLTKPGDLAAFGMDETGGLDV